MTRMVLLAALMTWSVWAQEAGQRPARSVVRASGQATVTAKPDQATIDIGVTSQGPTAQIAAATNAKQLDAVMADLRKLIGSGGELKTVSYSVHPNHRYPKDGSQPTIVGYSATNMVQAKTSDLAAVGKLIDASTKSGANQIHGLRFSLKDEGPVQSEALREAAVKARAKAEAMASALGLKVTRVLSAEEGEPVMVRPMREMAMAAQRADAPQTPVEPGTIEVRATVTVTVEVAP